MVKKILSIFVCVMMLGSASLAFAGGPAAGSAPPPGAPTAGGSRSPRSATMTRSGQVYVLDFAAGGEACCVTSSPLAARGPVWSPDGATIAYQSAVYPGATDLRSNRRLAAERKEAKSKVRRYESFPIRRWDKWLDETRTHVFVVPVDGAAPARDVLAGTKLAAEAGFGRRRQRGLERRPAARVRPGRPLPR